LSKENGIKKLILGQGSDGEENMVTIDIDPEHKPDVVHDLNQTPYPFKDDEFDEVWSHHVMEHLEELPKVMEELHRITKPGGKIFIEVPHHSSWMANTPDHKLRFNYFAFDGYVSGRTTWKTGRKFDLINREITFRKALRRFGWAWHFNRFPKAYERKWTYMFPAEHLKITLTPVK